MSRITLPPIADLATFVAVAETKSFKLAAERLFLTPSAISKKIKQLEQQLDMVLFERDHRHVRLTEQGQWLMSNVGELMQQAREFEHRLSNRQGKNTRLRIAAPALFNEHWLMPRLGRVLQDQPHWQIDIERCNAYPEFKFGATSLDAVVWFMPNELFELIPEIYQQMVELGLEFTGQTYCGNHVMDRWMETMADDTLVKQELTRPESCLVGAPSLGIAPDNDDFALVANQTWIHNSEQPLIWPHFLVKSGLSDYRPKKNLVVDSGSLGNQAVAQGMGVFVNYATVFDSPLAHCLQPVYHQRVEADISPFLIYSKNSPKYEQLVAFEMALLGEGGFSMRGAS